MSVYIQEVLGLLKRNKKKTKLDKVKDHFEFGKLYQNSTINTGAAYNPKMEPFVVKFGDLVCEVTENLTRTQVGSGVTGFVPVYTTPEGSCAWDTLMDSIITQNGVGDTISIGGNIIVNGTATVTSLTDNRVVIVGPGGLLEDDANFTMDGVTMTANVNVVHGTDVPAGTPAQTTTINSNLKLEGPVYDSLGVIGGLNKVLVGLADGRVKWQDDDVVEALTYGSLWQGDATNYKVELAIGTADQILISDGTTFAWKDNPAAIVGEVCDLYRIPLWTPDANTLGCSLLIQDGNSGTPATKITNDGQLKQAKELFLDTVIQNDALTQVLVRDTGAANEVKFRDVATIVPPVGFDTLTMSTTADWTQTYLNAYVPLDDTSVAFMRIGGMTGLTDGQQGEVIAENVKTGTTLAQDVIRFPNGWGVVGETWSNRVSWLTGAGGSNGYKDTDTLLFGESLKLKYINYQAPAQANNVLFWDSCCKLYSNNTCPTAVNQTFNIQEDTSLPAQTAAVSDDNYGGYGLTYTIVSNVSNGTLNFNLSTGVYTYTPNANYFGVDIFTYTASDGYCSTAVTTVTINIAAVAEAPSFTSACPSTASLKGGDTYTYNYTVVDPDHAGTELTVTFTLIDASNNASTWGGTATLTYNNDYTGTFTGTYPASGGLFTLTITVTDNDGNTEQQICTIAGLVADKDSYFNFWSDSSGSMNSTIRLTAKMSSQSKVIAYTSSAAGANSTQLNMNTNGGGVRRVDVARNTGFNAGGGGTGSNAHLAWTPGMELFGIGITAGTTIVSVQSDHVFLLSAVHTCGSDAAITGTITNAMRDADYADSANLRNLLQDFYATAGTQSGVGNAGGTPNTDKATNGSNRYDSHVIWCHGGVERPISCFANRGLNSGTGSGASNWFEDASQIVQTVMYDESATQPTGYRCDQTSSTGWGNRDSQVNTNVTDDVTEVKNYLAALPGSVTWRGSAIVVEPNGGAELTNMLGFNGVFALGTSANITSFFPAQTINAGAYTLGTQTLFNEYNSVPPLIRPFPTSAAGYPSVSGNYPGTINDTVSGTPQQQQAYYYAQIQTSLINHGYAL